MRRQVSDFAVTNSGSLALPPTDLSLIVKKDPMLDLADPVVAGQQVACCSHTVALMSRVGADAALFDAAGLLTPRCVMAHAIHLEQARRTAVAA